MNQTVFDVAIIGYGPAGATLANLLGQYGLSVLVLEREGEIYPLPRAIHFDGETMRVFETAGLRPQVESISRPGLKGMYFNNAAGETLLIRAPKNVAHTAAPPTTTFTNPSSKPCCGLACSATRRCKCAPTTKSLPSKTVLTRPP